MLLLGLAGVLWSAAVLPTFWRAISATAATAQIIADDRFKAGALAEVLVDIEGEPLVGRSPPELPRARALVGLRLAEDAMVHKSAEEAERDVAIAEERVRMALSLVPSDSFLWLMLYSVETSRYGFLTENLRYLDQSYATGPLESWIALRRNRSALAVFPMLSEEMQRIVLSEFVALVDSRFIENATTNLTGVGWMQRERLLDSLKQADIVSREAFAKKLARDGVNVSVPGVAAKERWWQ